MRTCTRGVRYSFCPLLSSSAVRCDLSLTQCASNNSIGSVPRSDSVWLFRVELDNARIFSRISARRSGDSGGTLINVIDAADLKFCLRSYAFFCGPAGHQLSFGRRARLSKPAPRSGVQERQTRPRMRGRTANCADGSGIAHHVQEFVQERRGICVL